MLYWHRATAFFGLIILLYVIVTGVGIQLSDMRALVTHAPATSPDMLMMRQHISGTPGFAVVSPSDYTASALPAGFDYARALQRTASLGRAAMPGAALTFVEVRVLAGRIVGHAKVGEEDMAFYLDDGTRLPDADVPRSVANEVKGSTRHAFKKLHQFRWAGPVGSFFSGVAGLLLGSLIFTGLWHYFKLLRRRRAMGRKALVWKAGGTWRDLHRATAIFLSMPLIWIAGTGIVMSIDDIGGSIHRLAGTSTRAAGGSPPDQSSPLSDHELPDMARITLGAFDRVEPGTGVRVLRLRYYAHYKQGIVIADDDNTSQRVFNAASGASMSMQEAGYPDTGFPYGWEWHQRVKQLHRGDFFGMTGRWLVTLGGLGLLYLGVSGPIMYWQMWRRRARNGRMNPVWK